MDENLRNALDRLTRVAESYQPPDALGEWDVPAKPSDLKLVIDAYGKSASVALHLEGAIVDSVTIFREVLAKCEKFVRDYEQGAIHWDGSAGST